MGRKSSFGLKLLVSVFVAGSFSSAFAASAIPSCGAASLATYISNTAFPPTTGGCAIGILDYYNFSYIMGTGPAASALEVTPTASGFNFSLASGAPITAAAGTTVKFEIDYQIVIDPAPIVTGGDLRLDPPSGDVTVTEYFCNDISYVPTGTCLGGSTPDMLQVGTQATGLPSSASITFADPARKSQQVGIVFTLNGGASGASFDGLDADSTVLSLVPEPASAGGVLLGLLTLAGGYKLRKRRNG